MAGFLPLMVALAVGAAAVAWPAPRLQRGEETWTERELARASFTSPNWRRQWIVEGEAALSTRNGRLSVVSPQATLWWRNPLPTDVAIELKAGVDGPKENNAANLNLIIHARERDGRPYAFGRSAQYDEYHEIPNYIATLTGGVQEGWSRLRRNPGFTILSDSASTRSEVGRAYRIKVLVAGGRVQYWLDGKLIHDAVDPQPLPGGHFALRTWRSRVWWSDIRFAAVTRAIQKP